MVQLTRCAGELAVEEMTGKEDARPDDGTGDIQIRKDIVDRLRRNVPDVLKDLGRWVVVGQSASSPDGESADAVPLDPQGFHEVDAQVPQVWLSFDTAVDVLAANPSQVDDVAFVLVDDDEVSCVELGGCFDPDTGGLSPTAEKAIRSVDSYTERSPSGEGVRIWAEGGWDPQWDSVQLEGCSIEMHQTGRCVTVTGDRADGIPATVEDRERQLRSLHQFVAERLGHRKGGADAQSDSQAPPDDQRQGDPATERDERPLPDPAGWPRLRDEAFYGLPGDVVRALEPHTEADPAGLLVTFLSMFGNASASAGGSAPYIWAGGPQTAKLFLCLVGDSAKARKGTTQSAVEGIFRSIDVGLGWLSRIMSGTASGEAIIHQVRDPSEKTDHEGEPIDAGSDDKRLLVVEEEFTRLLRTDRRDSSTVSQVIRLCWDGSPLQLMAKHVGERAEVHFVTYIGHTTRDDLRANLKGADVYNGFANRFLWIAVRRQKLLPDGGPGLRAAQKRMAKRVSVAINVAGKIGTITMTPDADDLWTEMYWELAYDVPPRAVGAFTARAETQILRIATAYAIADGSDKITVDHLRAARAVWDYARASVVYVHGGKTGDDDTDRLLEKIRDAKNGLTKTECSAVFNKHRNKSELDSMIEYLLHDGHIEKESIPTKGRSKDVYRAKKAKKEK